MNTARLIFNPFHMPGHKRQVHSPYLRNPYEVDITEITDFDNLHHAEGIIKDNQEKAASLYHADKTWFLINGSTAGILAAVSACTSRGGNFSWQGTAIKQYIMPPTCVAWKLYIYTHRMNLLWIKRRYLAGKC